MPLEIIVFTEAREPTKTCIAPNARNCCVFSGSDFRRPVVQHGVAELGSAGAIDLIRIKQQRHLEKRSIIIGFRTLPRFDYHPKEGAFHFRFSCFLRCGLSRQM